MASERKQTRRSISISGQTYDRLKSYCEEKGCSMSSVVEGQLKDMLPVPDRKEAIRDAVAKKTSDQEGSNVFTF